MSLSRVSSRKRIVFVEAWINPIYVRFANEFAKQNPDWDVYYITDKDAFGKDQLDTVSKRVNIVGLENIKAVRRVAYFPLYLGSFISKCMKAAYSDTLYLHTFRGLAKKLDEIKPDIVQSNVFVMPYTIQAGKYARKHNIPFVLRTEERAPHSLFQRIGMNTLLIMNKSTIKSARLILPWAVQHENFARTQFVVPKNRIVLLPAGVDTDMFSPGKRRTASSPLRLLTVQRFYTYKDYPTLLRGFKLARERGLNATLSILGFGPEEDSIRALVKELDLSADITFIKSVPYSKMPELFRKHDVLVHTGKHEAIGMVIPESMACGMMPVVCDTAGAITYVSKDTGIIFKTGDYEDLGNKLATLNPAVVRKRGEAAARDIKQKYAVPVTVKRYRDLLEKHVGIKFKRH